MANQNAWRPHSTEVLLAAVEHIEYEARWLSRGRDASCKIYTLDSDLRNLALEAALIHCRALLDFLCPRARPHMADILACEYVCNGAQHEPFPVVSSAEAKQLLGYEVGPVRQALDAWLAHLGHARLDDASKPQWDWVLTGCRRMFLNFVDALEDPWRSRFEGARRAASPE